MMDIQPDSITTVIPERIVLFGSEAGFSRPVLRHLLAGCVPVAAVVMHGYKTREVKQDTFPVCVRQPRNTATLSGLAAANEIPVLRFQNFNAKHLAHDIATLAFDILLTACFPHRITASLRQLARITCWNMHPSLLPRYRGPSPVFWQDRNGERQIGVTLHEITDRLDSGNIVAQKSFPLPTDTKSAGIEELVAKHGVDLFLEALHLHRQGRLITIRQDESLASYFPNAPVTGLGSPDQAFKQG